jgi:phage-related protein
VIIRELITLLGFKVDDTGQKEYNKDIDETKGKQQSLTASILKANLIGKAAGAVLGGAFSFIKDSVIGTTAEIERYKVALGTMMGDQEKANKIIHELDYSDTSDFYGTAAAVGGLKAMVTMGMEAQKASDILQKIGDVAQGDGAAFQSLSQNMGQVFAKGKADAMDLKQFVAQGFDVSGEVAALDMAKQMGVNVTAIDRQSAAFQAQRKAVEKAGISYEQTEAALISITGAGGKYEGMLEKQSNTLGGIINKFKSLKAATAEAIGTGISEDLKGILKYFLEVGRAGQEQFAGVFVKAIKTVIDFIWRVIVHAQTLRYRIEDIGLGFEPVIGLVKAFIGMFQEALSGLFPYIEQVGVYLMTWWTVMAEFLTPIITQLGPLFRKVFEFLASAVSGAIPVIQALETPLSVIGTVLGVIIKGLGGMIDFLKPIAPLIGAIAAIIGVWTAAQWLLNVAMMANPIGLIVAVVIAAVALIVGLVMVIKEHWTEIGEFFSGLWEGIKNIALAVWDAITQAFMAAIGVLKAAWNAVLDFFKGIGATIAGFFVSLWEKIKGIFQKYGEIILQVLAVVIFGIPGLIAVAVRQIIKHWSTIGPALKKIIDKVAGFFKAFGTLIANLFKALVQKIKSIFASVAEFFSTLWTGTVNMAISVWNTLKEWFGIFIETIKGIWGAITDFFAGLWGGIVGVAKSVWGSLTEWFSGLIEGIKAVWNGITGFFSGLWEALMNGPSAAIEYIRTAFTSLFDGIQQKLFEFIDKVKEGWDKVTGFFGNAVTGVANFFTGGDPEIKKTAPTKVNDMILTPDGQYQTSPDDYIMAMKDPMSLVDAVLRFLGQGLGGMPEPALAGAAGQGMMDAAMYQAAAAPTNYNNSTSSYSESFQAPITVNVNAASMSPQEAQAAVQRGVEDALKNAISSSRGNIPKPEVERY